MIDLIHGDCFVEMDKLITDGVKVDAIITDPPYGTTSCKWDSVIPFKKHLEFEVKGKTKIIYEDEAVLDLCKNGMSYKDAVAYFEDNCKEGMWERLNKLIKPNGAIVLFGSEPFSSALRMSNIRQYKYDWVWDKKQGGNPLNAKRMPLKTIETISVFNSGIYYPIMRQGVFRKKGGSSRQAEHTGKTIQGFYTESDMYYPVQLLSDFSNAGNRKSSIHPTQKPVELMEYLIKTYTNENELVLDFTMGSGSTGVACLNTNRNFIGIEKDYEYFNIAKERINNTIQGHNQ